jgi:hypothetical protein
MFPSKKIYKTLTYVSLFCLASFSMAQEDSDFPSESEFKSANGIKNIIGDFSTDKIENWKAKSFVGDTQYTIVDDGDKRVLKAQSSDTASGLAKEKVIDLFKTPFLNWSWKIDNALPNIDETIKDGDDYSARVYVVKSGGWRIWNTLALNYVWSSNQAKGSQWNNAFVGENAKMLAVKGVNSSIKEWANEKRNVYQDMIAQFGDKGSDKANEEAYRYLDAVALMTDTDNSHLSAVAYYADIYFSDK